MNTFFLKKLKKAISLTTLFVLLFSILNPFSNFVFAATLPSVTIASNNIYSGSLLRYGENATLAFSGSESLTGVTVTFNGTPALSVTGSGSSWMSTSQNIVSGTGNVNFTINYSDLLGSTGTTVTSTTDGSAVTIDNTSPTASINYSTTLPTSGNVTATLTGASESIVVTNNGGSFSHIFTDNGSFTFEFRDSAGNTGSTIATVANIDNISPVITSKEIKNIKETSVDLNITFNDTNFSSGTGVVEVTGGGSFSGSYNLNFSGNVGTTTMTGLTSDSSYTYALSLTDDFGNTTNTTGSFSTAKVLTVVGNMTETGAISLGFSSNLPVGGTYNLTGSLLINSDLNDSNSLIGSLTLSGITIVVGSGSWDGILIPPTIIDEGSDKAATGSDIGPGVTIIETIKVGSESAELTSSGGYFNVSLIVSGYSSGTILSLYRSENGNNWVSNTPDSNCTLNASSMCTFRTNHLSYFAVGFSTNPNPFSFTSLTGRELNTIYESNPITVSGISTSATVSVTGGEYKIGTGVYTSGTGTVNNGDIVTVRLTSSSSYNTLKTATLTIGGISAGFNVTTKAAPSSGGGSGGGGGGSGPGGGASSTTKDDCPDGDYSGDLYDDICGTNPDTGTGDIDDDGDNGNGSNGDGDNGNGGSTDNNVFSDIENSFAKVYIERLYEMGMVVGYPDGTFRPNNHITRAEFLGVTMKTLGIDLTSTSTDSFPDINTGDWINAYAIKGKEMGIIVGYSDGTFGPNNPITRAEALGILFKVAEINLTTENSLEFKDNDIQNWMIPYLIKGKELGIVSGQTINGILVFRPNDPITRAEGSTIIVKTLDL